MTTFSESESEEDIFNMGEPKEATNLLLKNGSKKDEKKDSNLAYPKSVFFIVGNEFCERFSFYGMKTILVIYLTKRLLFNENAATAIYHGFTMLCYFMPLFGAMLADGWMGKFRTILYLSIVYAIGNIVVSLTAFPPPEQIGPIIGLLLIGVGTGGIKPCVAAFGGDQFVAGQEKQQQQFFSFFYFAINAGSLISTLLTPVLRGDIQCFGSDCYPLAFGIPGMLMIVSLVIFVCGKNMYKCYPPTGNITCKLLGCIKCAISNKWKSTEKKDHWLDYADEKYEVKFIEDVRGVLRVLFLFIPLPVFWALFDQQGSRWTLQAEKMDGDLGPIGKLFPDQMQALNPILIICLIPLFESIIYPLLDKCKIPNRPLQRMVGGMFLASGSFVLAGFLQLHIQALEPKPLSVNVGGVQIINAATCPVHLRSDFLNATVPLLHGTDTFIVPSGQYDVQFTCTKDPTMSGTLNLQLEGGTSQYLFIANKEGALTSKVVKKHLTKARNGRSLFRLVYMLPAEMNTTLVLKDDSDTYNIPVTAFNQTQFILVNPAKYYLHLSQNTSVDNKLRDPIITETGAVYTVVIQENITDHKQIENVRYVDMQPNTVSILWQIPQYVVITTGEILFSISGLSFAYSQAPASMKSILQAAWLMTVAFGSLIVVIVAFGQLIPNQAAEFFMFASLMAVTTIIFTVMTVFYRYVNQQHEYDLPETDTAGLVDAAEPMAETLPPVSRESGL